MIKVFVTKQSSYPVNTPKLKEVVQKFFGSHGIVSEAEVSVAIVGKAKMIELSTKYLKDRNLHDVLSFIPTETKKDFVYPPDGIVHLGEIVVCYPQAFEDAKEEGKLIAEKVEELVEHGALHLLGIHHDE